MAPIRILLLGGTTEARQLATRLAARPAVSVLLSLAGRTEQPLAQSVPVRRGGFGGGEGLARFLVDGGFDLLIDATHPFAAQISVNAAQAAALAGLPALRLSRPSWTPVAGDDWRSAQSVSAALALCGEGRRRIFLAIGRQEAAAAEAAPQHFYLLRSVDPIVPPLMLPDAHCLLDRGPFTLESETALLESHGIELVIAKNSGGSATYAKIAAARRLALPVIMIERPSLPPMAAAEDVDAALSWIDHCLRSRRDLGV